MHEWVIHEQLSEYFDEIFNPLPAAFGKRYGCQATLLRLLEDWRKALDTHEYVAAILMDLSKAFDCLPDDVLLAKLQAYGVSPDAFALTDGYFSDRSQQIRMGSYVSGWKKVRPSVRPSVQSIHPSIFSNQSLRLLSLKSGTTHELRDIGR